MIVRGRAGHWLQGFIILGTLLLILNKTVFAEEPPQSNTNPFRLGVGLGVPYGVLGFNLSFRVNDLIEASGGYGSAGDGFKGWAVGGRVYPFPELKRFRPRLAAFYGVVGRVRQEDIEGDRKTIDVFLKALLLAADSNGSTFRVIALISTSIIPPAKPLKNTTQKMNATGVFRLGTAITFERQRSSKHAECGRSAVVAQSLPNLSG